MSEKARIFKGSNLRTEVREAAAKGASIEFKPASDSMTYQFALRDISHSGLGILVKKESDIFHHIHVGDVFHMKFHKGNASSDPEHLKVEIKHISEPAGGKPQGHKIIGLFILERVPDTQNPGNGYWQPL